MPARRATNLEKAPTPRLRGRWWDSKTPNNFQGLFLKKSSAADFLFLKKCFLAPQRCSHTGKANSTLTRKSGVGRGPTDPWRCGFLQMRSPHFGGRQRILCLFRVVAHVSRFGQTEIGPIIGGKVLAVICWAPRAQRRCYPTGRCTYRPSVTC